MRLEKVGIKDIDIRVVDADGQNDQIGFGILQIPFQIFQGEIGVQVRAIDADGVIGEAWKRVAQKNSRQGKGNRSRKKE